MAVGRECVSVLATEVIRFKHQLVKGTANTVTIVQYTALFRPTVHTVVTVTQMNHRMTGSRAQVPCDQLFTQTLAVTQAHKRPTERGPAGISEGVTRFTWAHDL